MKKTLRTIWMVDTLNYMVNVGIKTIDEANDMVKSGNLKSVNGVQYIVKGEEV